MDIGDIGDIRDGGVWCHGPYSCTRCESPHLECRWVVCCGVHSS